MSKRSRPEEGNNKENKFNSKTTGFFNRREGNKNSNRRSRSTSEDDKDQVKRAPQRKASPRFFQPKDSDSKRFGDKRKFSRGEETKKSFSSVKGKKRPYKKPGENQDNPKFLQPKDKDLKKDPGDRKNNSFRPNRSSSGTSRRKNYESSDSNPSSSEKTGFSNSRNYDNSKPHKFSDRTGNPKKNSYPRNAPKKFESKENDEQKSPKNLNSNEVRLNRYIANAGVCSRRDADLLIKAGEITVNGKVITEMGFKVKPGDEVRYNKRRLQREKLVYLLLNKPKDFITTTDDPENRKTIMNLVESAGSERIYPVGRLDRNTTGLILLTNDGELADKLSHPSNNIKKLYQVDLDKPILNEDLEKIKEGVILEDGKAEVDEIAVVSSDAKSLGLQIHSGKNRIVRRIFEHLGYDVVKLDRVMYAGLDKKDLPRGKWRFLSEKEIIRLKYQK